SAILAVVAENKLTPKAIIAVDLFGQTADFIAIRKIADKYNLAIIEDGAQGFGGSIDGKKACSFGDISTTSFFPAKPLGCYGDGGAIFTNNDENFALMQSLAVHGKGSDKYDNVRIGYNSRLDTLQAAILLVKLKAFEGYELDNRNAVADKYTEALQDNFVTPFVPEKFVSSWAQYTLILKDENERKKLQAKLKDKGVPTMVYYPVPMHKETAFKDSKSYTDLSVSENLSKCVMSVPMHPYLDDETSHTIISALME
ncbi:MAG: DegT/DnrJ/EryC1/StrS family aminotransferase, partial [Clostridia bacterium]